MEDRTFAVLIADDDADIREVLTSFVQEAAPNAKISQASNGMEALNKLGLQKFDLFITDLKMPRRDGAGVIEVAFNELDSSMKPSHVVIVSGQDRPDNLFTQIKSLSYFSKPIQSEAFIGHVRRVLGVEMAPIAKPKIDVAFVVPFVGATVKVLEEMAGVRAQKQEVLLRAPEDISGDISALVSISGHKYLGSMSVSFEEKAFLGIISAMLGEKHEKVTAEIEDAAAEICNQIFGIAKTELNSQGHGIQPAIPSVIIGLQHRVSHLAQGPCLAVRFKTEYGVFSVEAVVQPVGQ